MNPIIRITLRIFLVVALIFFATKPYNFFCNLSGKCDPFYFAYIFKGLEGDEEIDIDFEVTNYIENLSIELEKPKLVTVNNRINRLNIKIKNASKYPIEFRFELESQPKYFLDNLERFQCVCEQKYYLKRNEEKNIQMIFRIDKNFLDEDNDKKNYLVRFKTIKKII